MGSNKRQNGLGEWKPMGTIKGKDPPKQINTGVKVDKTAAEKITDQIGGDPS